MRQSRLGQQLCRAATAQMTSTVANGTTTTKATVFQNARTGLPVRSESTARQLTARRQLSQSIGRWKEMPLIESGVTWTACH
jgi:hypothetical protein